ADLRGTRHFDLGDHEADRRIHAGEVDAGGLAGHAAAAIAPDEIVRSQRRAIGQFDDNAAVVLREANHLVAPNDWHSELVDPSSQDALEVALPERKHVVVARREVADVQLDVREAGGRMLSTG